MCFPGAFQTRVGQPQAPRVGQAQAPRASVTGVNLTIPGRGTVRVPPGAVIPDVLPGGGTVMLGDVTLRLPARSSRGSGDVDLLVRRPGESLEDWIRRFQAFLKGTEGGELPPAAPPLPPTLAPRIRTRIGPADLRLDVA